MATVPETNSYFADKPPLQRILDATSETNEELFLKTSLSLMCNSAVSGQLQHLWPQRSPHHLQARERERGTIKVDNNLFKATAVPTGFISPSSLS